MDSPPPDPYASLNLDKNASQAQIKTAYRKLALKYHPDKAPDKGDEFHKISTAYELIGEEDARQKYDADLRLQMLKKEQLARFGPGHRGDPGVRTAAFDVRGSPRPDFQFQARTAPRFEERRPSGGFGPSSARPSPYVRDEGPDYFSPQPSARKYDSYDEAPRRPTAQRSSTAREEIRRPDTKKGKPDTKQKVHEDQKKQRTQNRGYDRRAKAASVYSTDDDSDATPRPRNESIRRDGFVRKKASKRSDDEQNYGQSKRPELGRKSYAEDYITSSRRDGPADREGAPPPPHVGERRNTRSPSPPPRRAREEATSTKGRKADLRPETVRRSSGKPKEKERSQTPEVSRTARPQPTRRVSGRRTPSPERSMPPKPKLYHAATEPNKIKIPAPDVDPRSERAQTQDPYREEPRVPPHLRRTDSAPSKSSPLKPAKRPAATPMQSSAPIQSSGLRKMETQEDKDRDSGYNTSSPSEDSPQQARRGSYRFSEDEPKSARYFREQSPERERDYERDRDYEREPPRRPTLNKERPSNPPISKSASYHMNDRIDAEVRQSPTSSRRPSVQRGESDRERRLPSSRDELPRLATRNRSDTQREASSRSIPRASDMQTGFTSPRERARAADDLYFGEIPQSRSPVNLTSSDDDHEDLRRGSPRDRDSDRRPAVEHNRSYRKSMASHLDSGYGTGNYGAPQMPQGRRQSEDIEKSRLDGATRYMEENSRPMPRRQTSGWT